MKKVCMGLVLVASAATLEGCASSAENLQRATAISINNNTAPESVGISNVQRGVTNVAWTATTPSGTYACSADDMVRRPYCARR